MLSRLMTRREQFVLLAVAAAMCLGALALYFHKDSGEIEPEPVAVVEPVDELAEPAVSQEQQAVAPAEVPAELIAAPVPQQKKLAVSVVGAVARPGLYRLDADARVHDLVVAAGGTTDAADLADINFAAILIDGTTLVIPSSVTAHNRDGSLVITRGERDAAQNPPQYRLSCWRQTPAAAAPELAGDAASGSSPASHTDASGLIDLNYATVSQLETLPGIGSKLAGRIVEYRMRAPFQTVDDVANVSGIGPKRLEAIRPFVTVHAPN